MAEFRTIPGRNCYRHINRDEKGKEKEKEEEEEEEKERKKNVFILGHFLGRKSRNNCPENPLLISINAREMDNGERVGVLQVISGAQTRWQHMAPPPPPTATRAIGEKNGVGQSEARPRNPPMAR